MFCNAAPYGARILAGHLLYLFFGYMCMSVEIKKRKQGSALVLDVSGRLTSASGSNELRDAIRANADEGNIYLLLNFADVAFLDSAGLGSLVASSEMLRRRGGLLRIMNAHGPVRHVLQITRLDTVFPDFQDEEAALASFPS